MTPSLSLTWGVPPTVDMSSATTERITQTVEITKHVVDIEEKGVKLRLTIVDTPGFGDAVNNTEWYVTWGWGPLGLGSTSMGGIPMGPRAAMLSHGSC